MNKFHLLRDSLKTVYPYDDYTITELLCRMYDDIMNLTGLTKTEIQKVVLDMIENGEIEVNGSINEEQIELIVKRVLQSAESTKAIENIVDDRIGKALENIPSGETPTVTINGSEYINLVQFAEKWQIATGSCWYNALDTAIKYCIQNKRSLFIPNGEYPISSPIKVISTSELGLVIQGESQEHCHLKFNTDGIEFDNGIDSIDYSERVRFITIKDLTIERQDRSTRTGIGLRFNNHGYVTLNNIRIRDFEKGLVLEDGSEDLIQNCTIMGNEVGVYLKHPIVSGKASDLALIKFDHCMLHNNYTNTLVADSVREVTFVNCALMNYDGSMVFNGVTNIVNFFGCVFENQSGIADLEINSSGIININNCQFANSYEKKIWVKSNIKLNLRDNLFQAAPRPIYIQASAKPTINNSDECFLGYWFEDSNFDNYNKPSLINVANYNFSTGSAIPYSQNVVGGCTRSCATGEYAVYFDTKQDNDIQFNLNLKTLPMTVLPKYAEIIITDNCGGLNLLHIQFADGTYQRNYLCGGADGKIGQFTKNGKNWIKIGYKLPYNDPNNPITLIGLVIPKSSSSKEVVLDSFNIYGDGCINQYYSDAKPLRGYWKMGTIVYAKDPEPLVQDPTWEDGLPIGWSVVDTHDSINTQANWFVMSHLY